MINVLYSSESLKKNFDFVLHVLAFFNYAKIYLYYN